MPATFFWFLPTNGDSRSIVGASHASSHHTLPPNYRAPSRRYLAEVARAADRLGYEGVLTPTGTWCEDAWLTASALLAETDRLKFLVAFRPGLTPPTLAAQQTATLQRFSEGRVLLNIVSGGDDVEQRRFGDWLGHDERYARTGEFLHIVNSVWRQDSLDFEGEYYQVKDARVSAPLGWDEVESCDPADFTVLTMPARLQAIGDPNAIMADAPGSLDQLLELALQLPRFLSCLKTRRCPAHARADGVRTLLHHL